MIDRVDDVCARLALNGQDDRRLVIVPAVLRDVLRADNSAPNVANPNGRAASESNDLVIEALRCPFGWMTVIAASAARSCSRSSPFAASIAGLICTRMAGFCWPPIPTSATPGIWEIFCAKMLSA